MATNFGNNPSAIRTHIKKLAQDFEAVNADETLDTRAKARRLESIGAEAKAAKGALDSIEESFRVTLSNGQRVDIRAFDMGDSGRDETGSAYLKSFATTGNAPAMGLSMDAMRGLHEAVMSHKSFKVEATRKDATPSGAGLSGEVVPQFGGFIPMTHEPTRVLDLIPTSSTNAPMVEYLRHDSTAGAPAMVAPGGLKPTATLNVTKQVAQARKIAVLATANDEDLADFDTFAQYLSNELQRMIIDTENAQILNGDGTGENLLGLLNQSGTLTRAVGSSESPLDALEEAFTDLRTGPAFCPASSVVLHPADWSKLRRTKDTQGRYLVNPDPTADAANSLWGVPVLQTTTMPAGTALVMNAAQGAEARVRQGITLQADFGQTGFEHNQTTFRCEERLMVFSPRPAALLKVTGL